MKDLLMAILVTFLVIFYAALAYINYREENYIYYFLLLFFCGYFSYFIPFAYKEAYRSMQWYFYEKKPKIYRKDEESMLEWKGRILVDENGDEVINYKINPPHHTN